MTTTKTSKKALAGYGVLGLLLIAVGFLCDGSTETGHHLGLILGGCAIGFGVAKEMK